MNAEENLIYGWHTWDEMEKTYDFSDSAIVIMTEASPYFDRLKYVHEYLNNRFKKVYLIVNSEIDFWETEFLIKTSKEKISCLELYYRMNRFHKSVFILEDETFLSKENYRILQTFSIDERLRYGILKEDVKLYD